MSTAKSSLTAADKKALGAEYAAGKYAGFINQVLAHAPDYAYGEIIAKNSEFIDCLEIFRDYVNNDVEKFLQTVKENQAELPENPDLAAQNLDAFADNEFRYTKFFTEILERIATFKELNKALTHGKTVYLERVDPSARPPQRKLVGCYKDIKAAAAVLAKELEITMPAKTPNSR